MTDPREPAPPPPDEGRLVGERYRLAEVIGVGGMATVHRATDTKLDRTVAVKLLRREVIADPDIAMRFRREALAATVLRHPNIVACLETGTDDGQPFLVMELIEGEDLAARLRRLGRLSPSEAARIGLDVARALGVAHIRGIVHRDVKPGNILLARDGRAMVTDFGIARLAADTEGAIPGTTLGSVHYFSPEQAKGETTTGASDVYSLGLVLYEALTGQRAWTGETTAALAAVRIGADAPSPRAIRPEIPAALDALVIRALDPDPARRFASGVAMASALEPIVSRPDPSSPTVGISSATLAAGAAAIAAGGAGRRVRRGRGSRGPDGGRAADAPAVGLEPSQTGRCDLGSAGVAGNRGTAVRIGHRRGSGRRRPVRRVASRRRGFGRRRTRHDHAKTDPDAAPDRSADPRPCRRADRRTQADADPQARDQAACPRCARPVRSDPRLCVRPGERDLRAVALRAADPLQAPRRLVDFALGG